MKILAAVLLLSACAFAQGGYYADKAIGRSPGSNSLVAIPGASVQVCIDSACLTPASIYSSITLAIGTLIGNSTVTADSNGNFSFFAFPGIYWCQVTATGFTTLSSQCQTGPATSSNPGVFTNTQQNLYLQSLLNGCNPLSQWSAIFGSSRATEAGTFCSTIPSGATVFQGNTIAAYVENQNGAATAGVAVFGSARATTTSGGRIWGGNFIATGMAGLASNSMYSTENDCNVANTLDVCHGMLVAGNFTAQPVTTDGITIAQPGQAGACTVCTWPYGIRFAQGATSAPNSNNAAIILYPVASGTSQVSQGMTFLGSSSGGTQDIIATENLDIGGNLAIVTSKAGSGIKLNSNPLLQEVSTGTVDLTAQGANIGSATLYATPASGGLYRVVCYIIETTAATTSSTLPSCIIGYTDFDNSTVQSQTFSSASPTGNSLTTLNQSTVVFKAKGTTNITYSTTGYATSGATSMQYAIHIRLEAM